jgi:sucrose phosphorylase
MIIVGAYPDHVSTGILSPDTQSLVRLKKIVNDILPHEIALHILPFYPSCGDGGFAITDWGVVDKEFGSWNDIYDIANGRFVIVDGVFNHIGIEHKMVELLVNNPTKNSHLFHINPCFDMEAPRGMNANHKIKTSYEYINVRKTHSDAGIDINLENLEIQKYVQGFLDMISNYKVKGVRLDAVTYYKKGPKIRHNEGSYELANLIANMVKVNDMIVIAQIDCDEEGKKYFCDPEYKDVAIYDLGYSAALSLAIAEKRPHDLVAFLQINQNVKRPLIRAPRSHDGILLRPRTLSSSLLTRLIAAAQDLGIPVRIVNDVPYELNCSLPYLIKRAFPQNSYKMLEMTLVLTGVLNSIPYFFLPYLVGFIPEESCEQVLLHKRFEKNDPRTLNRIPIDWENVKNTSFIKERLPRILEMLMNIHKLYGRELIYQDSMVSVVEDNLLKVSSANGSVNGIFNFSKSCIQLQIDHSQDDVVYSSCLEVNSIESGDYYVWVHNKL